MVNSQDNSADGSDGPAAEHGAGLCPGLHEAFPGCVPVDPRRTRTSRAVAPAGPRPHIEGPCAVFSYERRTAA